MDPELCGRPISGQNHQMCATCSAACSHVGIPTDSFSQFESINQHRSLLWCRAHRRPLPSPMLWEKRDRPLQCAHAMQRFTGSFWDEDTQSWFGCFGPMLRVGGLHFIASPFLKFQSKHSYLCLTFLSIKI